MSRVRLLERLELIELLLALAEESAASQRLLMQHCPLKGDALGEALAKLAFYESSIELRKAERQRLQASLARP